MNITHTTTSIPPPSWSSSTSPPPPPLPRSSSPWTLLTPSPPSHLHQEYYQKLLLSFRYAELLSQGNISEWLSVSEPGLNPWATHIHILPSAARSPKSWLSTHSPAFPGLDPPFLYTGDNLDPHHLLSVFAWPRMNSPFFPFLPKTLLPFRYPQIMHHLFLTASTDMTTQFSAFLCTHALSEL